MSFVGANISIIVDGDASNTKRHSRKALQISKAKTYGKHMKSTPAASKHRVQILECKPCKYPKTALRISKQYATHNQCNDLNTAMSKLQWMSFYTHNLDVSQGLMNEKLRLSPGKVSSNDDTVNTGRWVSSYKIKATSNVI